MDILCATLLQLIPCSFFNWSKYFRLFQDLILIQINNTFTIFLFFRLKLTVIGFISIGCAEASR